METIRQLTLERWTSQVTVQSLFSQNIVGRPHQLLSITISATRYRGNQYSKQEIHGTAPPQVAEDWSGFPLV